MNGGGIRVRAGVWRRRAEVPVGASLAIAVAIGLADGAALAAPDRDRPSAQARADNDGSPVIEKGDRGEHVLEVQRRLRRLRFFTSRPDGHYGKETRTAVWAFQKANRLRPRDSVDRRTWQALRNPRRIRPLAPGLRRFGNRAEIDLRRQLMFIYRAGQLVLASHISTGARRHYCERGHCGDAITPTGDFRVYRQVRGWQIGVLGAMYFPSYIHGGIAIHGSAKVPLRPASHGCVRVPLHNARRVFRLLRHAGRVFVRHPSS